MPFFQPHRMRVTCPTCSMEVDVAVFPIIDSPDMRDIAQALILGVVNIFQCPRCGTSGMISTPLLYHNAEKKLAYLFIPPTQQVIPQEERQRLIGELTRAVMNSLPNEHPKGYLLQPREFLTFPSMLEAIMEAEGIDRNLLEDWRKKGALIDKLLTVVDDDLAFASVIGQHRQELTPEFYEMLRYARDSSLALGQREEAEKLERLRQRLLPLTEWGRKERALDRALAFLRTEPDRERFLERLIQAEDENDVEALVKVARPLADYAFFKMLTDRIKQAKKAGKQEEAERLARLRDRVLQLTEEVDRQTQEAVERATHLLRTFLSAPDLEKAVDEHLEEIDDTFMFVLSAQIDEAKRRNIRDLVAALRRVSRTILRRTRPDIPFEILVIEDLATLEYPDETREYLEDMKDELTPEVLAVMDAVAGEMERRGLKEEAKRLRAIRAQALALMPAPTG